MEKYIEYFLNRDTTYCSNEKFDYKFDYKSTTKEKFLLEYSKFLGMYSTLFFYNQHLVTAFNSFEIRLKKEDINILIKMYKYTKENKYDDEKNILIEFFYTYFKTIYAGAVNRFYCRY